MTVYIVGAGVGRKDYMTLRAFEVLKSAQIVVHDRLIDFDVLSIAPKDAQLIDVGKEKGKPFDQNEINSILVRYGKSHLRVVRLKGGDPFVYGRGGEEVIALKEAGIDFEVVPGISSAIAAPLSAGVPVTHRGISNSFTVITGHLAPDSTYNWKALASSGSTLILLMGVAHREAIAEKLIENGRNEHEPVAIIEFATRSGENVLRCELKDVGTVKVNSPATIVIGEVAALDLRSVVPKFKIAILRDDEGSSELKELLNYSGFDALNISVIEIVDPLDGGAGLQVGVDSIDTFDWVIFTSANSVRRFTANLRDARSFKNVKVGAIGPSTSKALKSFGIEPDFIPNSRSGEGFIEEFGEGSITQVERVLIPRSSKAADTIPKGLVKLGYEVVCVDAYGLKERSLSVPELDTIVRSNLVIAASPSQLDVLVDQTKRKDLKTLTIGNTTFNYAKYLGLEDVHVSDGVETEKLLEATCKLLLT